VESIQSLGIQDWDFALDKAVDRGNRIVNELEKEGFFKKLWQVKF
jgi:hypothetical protein